MSEASNPERGPVAAQTLDGDGSAKSESELRSAERNCATPGLYRKQSATTLRRANTTFLPEWFGVLGSWVSLSCRCRPS